MPILTVIIMYGIWSSTFSLAKLALQYSPPFFFTGFRMMLAGLLMGAYLVVSKGLSLKKMSKAWISILLLAFFSIYLTNVLEFWALQHLPAGKTCFIYSFSPLFAAFFSYLHFGEKINLRKSFGLGIGLLGILPIIYLQTGSEQLLNAFAFFSWPTLAIIGAALSSVYGWVLLRIMMKDQDISPLVANGASMFIGGAFGLFHSSFVESWNPLPISLDSFPFLLGWTLLIILVSNILAYNLYGLMLKRFTATFLSLMGLVSPIFASVYGWLFLGEPISGYIFLFTAVVCLGMYIVYNEELKQGYIVHSKKIQISEGEAICNLSI